MCSIIAPALTPAPLACKQVSDPFSFLHVTSAYNSTDNIVVAQSMLWNYYWMNNRYPNGFH